MEYVAVISYLIKYVLTASCSSSIYHWLSHSPTYSDVERNLRLIRTSADKTLFPLHHLCFTPIFLQTLLFRR